jgi:hypothetical protein
VLCTSTTGVAPETVIVSAMPLRRRSPFTDAVKLAGRSTSWRRSVTKPGSVNVTVYRPGRRSTMRYWPALSETADFIFSIRAGLDASTVTPGSTAPLGSRTVPVMVLCANDVAAPRNVATIHVAAAIVSLCGMIQLPSRVDMTCER